jgi:nucleotide-binding universal stress UspA family protein
MKRALVVVGDSSEAHELGTEAGRLAAGANAELHVVQFIDQAEYETQLQRAATSSQNIESIQEAKAQAEKIAEGFAEETLGGINIDVHTDGVIDEMPGAVVSYAIDNGCDHIFIAGEKRSPTGKALFGDTTQSIILNFDGSVTVRTA